MVARAERAALVAAALQRPVADAVGIGPAEAAAGLGVLDVAVGGQAARLAGSATPSAIRRRSSLPPNRYGPPRPRRPGSGGTAGPSARCRSAA